MSFDTKERSSYDGKPFSLYEFSADDHFWRFTSEDADVTFDSNLYRAVPISVGGMVQSGNAQTDDIKVTMPADEDVVRLYLGVPPSETVWLTIRRKHRDETDAPIVWIGSIKSVRQVGVAKAELTCNVLSASFNRNGLRLAWGRQCPHALYDLNCKVDRSEFAVVAEIDLVDGINLVATVLDTYADGYFSNGFVEFVLPSGIMERRAIEIHVGTIARLLDSTFGVEVGDFVTFYPGCKRNTEDCDLKFDNLSNYGGFPHMPGKSPFDGTPVF